MVGVSLDGGYDQSFQSSSFALVSELLALSVSEAHASLSYKSSFM